MSRKHENYREEVIGRANVEDTPELLEYYNELNKRLEHFGQLQIKLNPGNLKVKVCQLFGVIMIFVNMSCVRLSW